VTKPDAFDLDADEIVTAAVEIFQESGLDAVSMRSVSSRLGVSPVPLYSRVGNKDALLDAIAERLLVDLAPPSNEGEPWNEYGMRWARELRVRLRRARDSRLIVWPGRAAYVEATRPLVETMRRDGFATDAAVQACRLLTWATVGFAAVESGVEPPGRSRRQARPGGDPGGVDAAEVDTLFDLHIRYVIEGIARDVASEGPAHGRKRR
jgi:AcrR family transcriptional regulator